MALYRLYLHPLSAHPGPLVAKVTDFHQLWHSYRGDRHLELWRLHETYGPVVRFGPNSLSFNTASSLKQVYGFKSNVRKAQFYDAFVHPAPNTHNCRDRALHARKRRVMAHAFSDSAIKEMERYILANVRTFCEGIGGGLRVAESDKGGQWTSPKCMSDWFSWLSMDILGDLCFGKAFHMLERDDNRFAIDLVSTAAHRHLIVSTVLAGPVSSCPRASGRTSKLTHSRQCGTMPILNTLSLDRLLFPNIAAGRARYMAYSRAQLTERTRLGDETDRRDFFYHLLKARDPETGLGFSTPELWGESNLLIIAGSDTTSTALAATLFYLVRSPDALARVAAEIRARFNDVEEIRQGTALNSCAYLRACIDEAMRLSPSVGGIVPREVMAGGMTVDGVFVPAGTVVGVAHYAIHHNAAYFPEPFRFVPERWIAGSKAALGGHSMVGETDVAVAQSAFCPFSLGPRGCIGKGLAYVEMSITLARTLWLYDVRRAVGVLDTAEGREGAEWGRDRSHEMQLTDTFTSLKKGVMVDLRKRQGI